MAMLGAMPEPSEIISMLGGYRSVAKALGVPHTVAHKWKKRGIPARYWNDVATLAKKRGVKGITVDAIRRPLWLRAPNPQAAA